MSNLNEKMVALGTQRSVIRELFEFGKMRAAEIGAENVFDFSIGNPSVPAPACVNETAQKSCQKWIQSFCTDIRAHREMQAFALCWPHLSISVLALITRLTTFICP